MTTIDLPKMAYQILTAGIKKATPQMEVDNKNISTKILAQKGDESNATA